MSQLTAAMKHCPEPRNAEEHHLQDEEDKSYVRGRIAYVTSYLSRPVSLMALINRFIEEDPGRQSISGSFNPIDEGEWSESAYIQATAKFFGAISKNDTVTVVQMIEDGEDINRRDHVGRTPLHVAVLSNSVEVAGILIDAGARMTARLVGGRTSFHLAVQMGQSNLVKKMLVRSAYNEAEEEKRKIQEVATAEDPGDVERVRMSSEDDWSSEESDDGKPLIKAPTTGDPEKDADPLEDDKEAPDVLDISIPDWDFGLTALGYAIVSGSLEVVGVLLAAGADPNFVARAKGTNPLHPLTLTIYTQDEGRATKIAELLVSAQAISSAADEKLFTIFHRIVVAKRTAIVSLLLTRDPNAKKVLDVPAWSCGFGLVYPVVSSIYSGDYATLSVLLAHGARLAHSPDDAYRPFGVQ
jgi:ankyrin repeat protein